MSLTSSSVDGGYPLSVSAKESVRHHLGERCIVCGYPAVTQVAHIIPRSVQSNAMLYAVRRWSPVLATFRKNQIENLLLLCPNHHAEYDQGMFTIVPVAEARAKMKEYEIQDFQRREGIVRDGHADPGRTFVQPSDITAGFEVVPISAPYYVDVHDRTPDFPDGFMFDSLGFVNPVNRCHRLYPYPLLATAAKALTDPFIDYTPLVSRARDEVHELCRLYNRIPGAAPRAETKPTYSSFDIPKDPRPPSGKGAGDGKGKGKGKGNMPSIPEADNTGEGGASGSGGMVMDQDPESPQLGKQAVEDQGPGSSTETDTDGSESVLSGGRPAEVEIQDLLDDDDDPVVTPAALIGRLRWKDGPFKLGDLEAGSLRYATSSDFVADPPVVT